MSDMVETTFFIQVEPEFSRYAESRGVRHVLRIRARNLTLTWPTKAAHPVVQLTLRMPKAAFMPLAPTVIIEVPESAIDFTPIVIVDDVVQG